MIIAKGSGSRVRREWREIREGGVVSEGDFSHTEVTSNIFLEQKLNYIELTQSSGKIQVGSLTKAAAGLNRKHM